MILNPRRWPFVVKVPASVALLMLIASVVVSAQVLSRLSETQARHLEALSGSYLDGVSSSLIPHLLRDDTWEVFDNLERAKALYRSLKVQGTIVTRPNRSIVASTDPARFPTEDMLPSSFGASSPAADAPWPDVVIVRRDLSFQDRPLGTIWAMIDTQHLASERRSVLWTLAGTNAVLTLILAAGGWFVVWRMLKPLRGLNARLEAGTSGKLTPFSSVEIGDPTREFGRLYAGYNAMAQAVAEREALTLKSAEEKRLASLGRLSSVIAHEINNPLGGLINAVDTIKRHGDTPSIRAVSVGLLERGLNGIREVVETTLAVYRPDRNRRDLKASDLDDLRLLVEGAAKRRQVDLEWQSDPGDLSGLPSGAVRQIILNLVLNGIEASPVGSKVIFSARTSDRALLISVGDQGGGMPPELQAALQGQTETTTSVPGIGLSVVRALVAELAGEISILSQRSEGTTVQVVLPRSPSAEIANVA
ncbi:MAG: HAMP domain-containing histidine kinase [Rhizobiales bacterium]|nr:HAMP domain-containing histidine kinase [Hyphomicrobiales bacterium]